MMDRLAPPSDPEYKAAYNRGWKASSTTEGFALDGADSRNEPPAWYDGYFDYAASRQKWHLAHCTNHHNEARGCGQA